MSVESKFNRDINFKVILMFYLAYVLKLLNIDEEIKQVLNIELIGMKLGIKVNVYDMRADYAVSTKSNKIILFEFKKGKITLKDLKQAYTYKDHFHCREKCEVISVLITIEKEGHETHYEMDEETYHPTIFPTKMLDKTQDLKTLRNKLNNNVMLTEEDCALLVACPLFETSCDEKSLTKEVCNYIKNKKNLIPEDELHKAILGTYLNIVEYIEINRQNKFIEMINMATVLTGVVDDLKEMGAKETTEKHILNLLEVFSVSDTAKYLKVSEDEVRRVSNKYL